MSTFHSKPPNAASELNWDAFVASLHRVWEYAPDFSPTRPVNLSGRKFLVVDRDTDHSMNLGERMKRLGASVISVTTIRMAFLSLDSHLIDLIVLSTDFPGEDALQFCRVVSDGTATMHLPLIMLSDDDRPDMVGIARRAGAAFYLRKPYDPYVLITLMSAALEPAE